MNEELARQSGVAPPDRHWSLDRRVNISIIGAVIIQVFGFGWWMSDLSGRLEATAVLAEQNRIANIDLARRQSTADTTLARFDERLIAIYEVLRRIEKSVSSD